MFPRLWFTLVFRLSIVADAVWSSPPSTKKKDIEISIKTLEGKSQIPVSSHLGVTITREECFTEMNGLNLKLYKTIQRDYVHVQCIICMPSVLETIQVGSRK